MSDDSPRGCRVAPSVEGFQAAGASLCERKQVSECEAVLIKCLVDLYRERHLFQEQPNHFTANGRYSIVYDDAVNTYGRACARWVCAQAARCHIPVCFYELSNGFRSRDHGGPYRYFLYADKKEVLRDVTHVEAQVYLLRTMRQGDLYREMHMTALMTGMQVRQEHNAREKADGKGNPFFTPRYSYGPGPFSSEERHWSVGPSEG